MRILLIEDHKRLSLAIVEGLRPFGFGVDAFGKADDGLAARHAVSYDAIVLDLGLPDKDGMDVLSELRQDDRLIPVLILTARDDIEDRVTGLDRGADDYLLKPFAMKELAARLRAVLRRPGRRLGSVLDFADLCFDTSAQELKINATPVAISRRETAALEILMRRAGEVVSKETLDDALYGLSDDVSANAVEAVMSRLRKRLERAGSRAEIHTLRGIGYLLRDA
jgi:DNA-binding response OmpR family regulator